MSSISLASMALKENDEHPETERIIVRPARGKDGLFIQPRPESSNSARAKREMEERLNRQMFAEVFDYADPLTGNTATYDPEGNYNCGGCNKQHGSSDCTLIPISVDAPAGGCRKYEIRRACDRELDVSDNPRAMTAEMATYGVAANGVGFGCKRCPFQEQAYEPDSVGRTLYCGQGNMRVFRNACCAINGAKVKSEYEGNKPVKRDND